MDELKTDIEQFLEIARTLTELSKRSRELRIKIGESIESLGLGKVTEDDYVEFLNETSLIRVKKAKGEKDYTILSKPLSRIA